MALANFFDRAAMAASQVLAGFDAAAFSATLGAHAVCLAFDANAVGTTEGRAALDMCVRLLARLYPTLSLAPLDDAAADAAPASTALARAINPDVAIRPDPACATLCIVVGRTAPRLDGPTTFIGSDGWTARLSRAAPVGSGPSGVPFGAGAAACLAAANAFRTIFAAQLQDGGPDDEVSLSLLTYGAPGDGQATPPGAIELGEAHLVGLGAIGNGAAWALSGMAGLSGTLHLVDHEAVDLLNLQRYAMAGQADVGAAKVDVAARVIAASGLEVVAHRMRWDEYVAGRADRRFPRVAVALDTAADRIAVQGSLPAWIVNAWTQDLDLGVSRHRFDDGRACLACLYLPTGKAKDEDERLADELRMPEARMEIRRMLQTCAPLDEAFIQRVALAMGLPAAELVSFAGQPLRALHQAAICGGLAFKLSGGATPVGTVVPMAFQSAMAGIMLAADLVKKAAGMPDPPTTCTRVNLLRPLAPVLDDPRAKDASGRCICADEDFLAAYRLKYAGVAAAEAAPLEQVRPGKPTRRKASGARLRP